MDNGVKPVNEYLEGEVDVVIPDVATEVGEFAFAYHLVIKSVTFHDNFRKISNFAFESCLNLSKIDLGCGVEEIGYGAFSGCNITEFHVPKSVIKILGNPIDNCKNLEAISVEEGNTAYHSAANCLIETETRKLIAGCKNSVIPTDGSVEEVDGAFVYCEGLSKIVIPESVKKIKRASFLGCKNLTIYCEAEKPQEGWEKNWNVKKGLIFKRRHKIVWGYKADKM